MKCCAPGRMNCPKISDSLKLFARTEDSDTFTCSKTEAVISSCQNPSSLWNMSLAPSDYSAAVWDGG